MSLKKQTFSGIIWTFTEMFGGQLINFFVNMILARLLVPEDFGLLGMIFVFITLSNTLMDSGVTSSIMREQNPKEEDFSTLFVSNVFFSVVIYIILFFVAPFIANFYDNQIITDIIRVYGLTIIIQAFVQVQSVYLIKQLNFKKQTLMKLPSIVISSIIAIWIAYNGYGVWSLVWMYLSQNFFWALFHWLFGDWRPKTHFQKKIFKKHFGYGYRMTLVELMNNISANIYQIVIGKFYNPTLVGYYTQSLTLRQVPVSNIYGAAIKVLFPAFAKIQNDREAMVRNFFRVQEILLLILVPILVFLAYNAEDILVVLFSENWRGAKIYLQVVSIAGISNILSNWNLAILKIVGHAKQILHTEFVLKVSLFLLIVLAILLKNINYLLICIIVFSLLTYLIYNLKVCNVLNVSFGKSLRPIFSQLLLMILPLLATFSLDNIFSINNLFLSLSLNLLSFFGIYFILTSIFKGSIIKLLMLLLRRK